MIGWTDLNNDLKFYLTRPVTSPTLMTQSIHTFSLINTTRTEVVVGGKQCLFLFSLSTAKPPFYSLHLAAEQRRNPATANWWFLLRACDSSIPRRRREREETLVWVMIVWSLSTVCIEKK